jgi:hypothetical protein
VSADFTIRAAASALDAIAALVYRIVFRLGMCAGGTGAVLYAYLIEAQGFMAAFDHADLRDLQTNDIRAMGEQAP